MLLGRGYLILKIFLSVTQSQANALVNLFGKVKTNHEIVAFSIV